MLVVLDTNVLVSGIRSRRGASFQVLSLVGTGAFDVAISVPLVLEYEAAMLRHIDSTNLAEDDARHIVDYICSVARRQTIFFLWRPLLKDPNDDMVAEVAVASACDALVTHNRKDFDAIAALGLRVISPQELLQELGRSR